MRINILVPVCLLALLGRTSLATDPVPEKKLPAVAAKMASFVESKEVAGVVTLVADQDGILHLDAAGMADVAGNRPMTTDAVMWIASMTKPITATAVLMLQDEGKLSVDDPVAKYLPEFAQVMTPAGKPANLTLKHLLTHTSGLAEPPAEISRGAKVLADLIPSIVAKPTQFEPGSKWQYCQSGINTLGRIVEVVGGEPFPRILKKRIFDPLGMVDTAFYPTAAQAARLAKTYKKVGDKLEEAPLAFLNGRDPTFRDRYPLANGGLFSTASDYAKFLNMVLHGGSIGGKTYLSPQAVTQMTTVQSGEVQTGFTPGNGWGLGWCVVKDPQGVTASLSSGSYGHGGAYGTQAWIDPKKNLIYVLMVQRQNFPNSDASEVRKAFHDEVVKALGK